MAMAMVMVMEMIKNVRKSNILVEQIFVCLSDIDKFIFRINTGSALLLCKTAYLLYATDFCYCANLQC